MRIVSIGRGLVTCSMIAVGAGLIGLILSTGASFAYRPGSGATASLSTLYPGLWIWWIPESFLGSVPYLVVAGLGIHLALLGRRILRIYH